MAVAYRSSTTAGNAAGTSVVNSAPAGLANDDILLFCVYKENSAAVTWPSGFTQIATVAAGTALWLFVAYKRAASESGTYTASWTGSAWRDGLLAAYSGCITSGDPDDATPTSASTGTSTGTVTWPSITTITANTLIVLFGARQTGATLNTPPSGATARVDFDDSLLYDFAQAAAGATAAKTATLSSTSPVAGITLALKPPGAASTSPIIPPPRTPYAILAR